MSNDDFAWVVMAVRIQHEVGGNLAEILPRRPLAPEEVRELLLPTIDALLFLHRKGLVHGRLKPSNFMAVNDQLKLASDSIRPVNPASRRAHLRIPG